MNDLEIAAQPYLTPMLEGRGRALHREGQTVIATWALKTAMMAEFTMPAAGRGIPADDYAYLYAEREPPPTTAVLLAAYGGMVWSVYYRQHALLVGEGATEQNGYAATIAIGQLVLQVFGTQVPGQTLGISPQLVPYVHQVWPYSNSLTWTPRPALNDAQLHAFADAIGPG